MIRELTLWRVHDLATQAVFLAKADRWLGALILLRACFESLPVLIYLNGKMLHAISEGVSGLFDLDESTHRLLLGSKNGSTPSDSINVMTLLKHCEKVYPGIEHLFADLSESAHPNYEGLTRGYSTNDVSNLSTKSATNWNRNERERFLRGLALCITTFEVEYNTVWIERFERLESWLVANDDALEAERLAKSSPAQT